MCRLEKTPDLQSARNPLFSREIGQLSCCGWSSQEIFGSNTNLNSFINVIRWFFIYVVGWCDTARLYETPSVSLVSTHHQLIGPKPKPLADIHHFLG